MENSHNLIKKALIEEAELKIRKRIINGEDIIESIDNVARTMFLEDDEKDELTSIFTEPKTPIATKNNPHPNSIYFNDGNDVEQASGILMYNKTPWESRSDSDEKSYIQFSDKKSLESGMKVLSNKWDFIENDKKNIGTISFDNIDDYKKVLDFINRSGMFIEFNMNDDLDDTDEDEENLGESFIASSKNIKNKINPTENKEQRSVSVRKRFK